MCPYTQGTLKNGIAFVLSLIMLLNLLPIGIFRNIVYAENIATGTSGTCTWVIDSEGTLTIKPTNGEEGTLKSNTNYNNFYPWRDYRDSIKHIKIDGTVNVPAGVVNLFADLDELISVNLHGLNTSNTANMSRAFSGCSALKYLDISMLNTGNVTAMNAFFPNGMWTKKENGIEYPASQITRGEIQPLSQVPGKYEKSANIEHGLEIKEKITFNVDFKNKETIITIKNNENIYETDKNINYTINAGEIDSENSTIPGVIEIIYKNAVTTANNEIYDFKVTIDNIRIYNESPTGTLLIASVKDSFSLSNNRTGTLSGTGVYYDVELQVIDNNGNPQEGTFVFTAFDIDQEGSRQTYNRYAEGIIFSETLEEEKIKLSNWTCLDLIKSQVDNNRWRVQGTRADDMTEASMVLTVADASGFKFTWTAWTQCTTGFMNAYNPSRVKVRKIDEQGNPLAGAKLSIYMKNSELYYIDSWTTTNEDIVMFLNPGTYILRETEAPDSSYELAEDIEIYVESDGTIAVAGEGVVEDVVVKMKNYKKSAKVIVNHYIMEPDGALTENRVPLSNGGRPEKDHIIRGKVGESYNTQALTAEELADEYEYVKVVGNASGEFTAETQYITYYYRLKQYPYIVNYYDKETGELIGPKTKQGDKQYLGTEILTKDEIIEIEGYEYDSADVESIEIVKDVDKNVINIYYIRKKGTVITKYKDIETGEEIEKSTKTEDGVGKDYTTEKKEIPGYIFVKDTENTSGKYIDGEIKVIYYYRKQVFNLKLDKWVDSIIINGIKQKGNTFDTKDKVIKTEINKNKIAEADVKVVYKIRITNDSEVAGKVEKLIEKIPSGLKFYQEDNSITWKEENGALTTEDLKDIEIEPGKYAEIAITLRWDNKEENFGTKVNLAKLDKANNRFDYEEKTKEDNQDQAELVFAIVTGLDSVDKIILTRAVILVMTMTVLTGTVIGIKKKINA